jgi:hypothetical protein
MKLMVPMMLNLDGGYQEMGPFLVSMFERADAMSAGVRILTLSTDRTGHVRQRRGVMQGCAKGNDARRHAN